MFDINMDIPGLTTYNDLITLCSFTKELNGKNKIILEIGTFCGRTSYIFSKNSDPTTKVFSIDHWKAFNVVNDFFSININDPKRIFLETKRKYKLDNVTQIPKLSPLKRWGHEKIDLLFLDGNHTYEIVYRELKFYVPHCQTNSIICGHDYHELFPGLIEAVDQFSKENGYEVKKFPDCIWRIFRN